MKQFHETGPREGTEIGNSLEFDFVVPPPQLSRAVKADEISVVERTQPLRLARQSKIIERLDFCPSLFSGLFLGKMKGISFFSTEIRKIV